MLCSVVTAKVPNGSRSNISALFLEKTREVDAEIIQREVRDRDAAAEVFEVDDSVLKLEELLAAIFQIVHLIAGLVLDDVFLAGSRNVEEHHAAADALFEVDVFLKLHIRPEIDQLDSLVRRANAVDSAEALDDADRVPMDVVIDDSSRSLEGSALR